MHHLPFLQRTPGSAAAALLLGLAIAQPARADVLAGWDVNGVTGYGVSPMAATTDPTGATVGGLTRGSGVATSGSPASNAWGGVGWTSANAFAQFSITPDANYILSFTTLDLSYRRSGTGPTSGTLQYSTDGTNFTNITTLIYSSTSSSGATLSGNALSIAGASVTTARYFRILNTTGASTGTWYVNNTQSGDDLAVNGTIAQRSVGTLIWDGGQTDANWSTYSGTASNQSNWDANKIPASGLVDAIQFAGSTRTTTTNNVTGLTVGSLAFNSGASAFTVNGNAITLNSGIANNATTVQTVSLAALTLGGAQTFNAASGDLSVSSTIALGNNTLTVDGPKNTTLSGVITGAGSLIKSNSGTLTVSGSNSYSGTTMLNAGTLLVSHTAALGTGNVLIQNAATLEVAANVALRNTGRTITLSSSIAQYRKDYGNGESFANANSLASNVGGISTTAAILGGTANASGLSALASFGAATAETQSDVLTLSGLDGKVFALALTVGTGAVDARSQLGWFDSINGWELAVAGNSGSGSALTQSDLGYAGTFAQFQNLVINAGTGAISDYLGAYGSDAATGQAWAIVNHNSDFAIVAVVPEPGTVALVATAAGVIALVFRRRATGRS